MLLEQDIKRIILEGKLASFILGRDEFLTNHPGVDYSRWSQLERYYKDPNADILVKEIIDATILDLYKESDESVKYASVTLGRMLRMPAIRQIIIDEIANSDIRKYSKNLQDEFLFSATILQLSEVAMIVLKRFTTEDRLGEFIMCSSIPPYTDKVGEDDLWRIQVLGQFFGDSSTAAQESIYSQIEKTVNRSKNFRSTIQKYLSIEKTHNLFHQNLEKILADYKGKLLP